ncbi:radical SAM protein [Candidatus Parcubacteria bacterium]|nr:MAG: radical SAM protein [Candidatus Parcubacteria bacterium]
MHMAYDILLINAHRDHFGSVPEDITIGVNLLTVFLREKGYNASVFRGSAHETMGWIEERIKEEGVKSTGFYCDYENFTLVEELGRKIKEKWAIPVFAGGPQSVGLGEDFLRKSLCDVIVHGDGEFTLLDLMAYIKNEKKLEEIDGISYLDSEGNMIKGPSRKPVEDLDSLPWPDFRMDRGHKTWRILPVMSGRGCPYQCAFCYEGSNTRKVRFRSVENVMKEICCHFERHPQLKYIFFVDDTFTLDPKRVEKFCRELSRLRKERDFVWFCEGHVQTLFKWPEMLQQMAESGMVKLFLGIESGSDRVLELYRKKTTVEMIRSVIKNSVKAGIPQITGNIIIGGPIESPETLEDGRELITELLHMAPGRFDSIGFFLMPYPNTAIKGNPGDFGISLLPERELHGLEDIPLTETDSLSWTDMFKARFDFNRKILKTMRDLYMTGKVPHETLLTNYGLAYRYGVHTRWLINVFTLNPIYHSYYQLLARNILKHSGDIKGELLLCRPCRVFEIWNTIIYDGGYPRIDKHVLSPLEYELLLLCSGKLRLSEILDRTGESVGQRFDSRDDFKREVFTLLKSFEERRWIAYSYF